MADTLIDRITEEMADDYDNMDKQSHLLIETYTTASPEGQAVLDAAFVCLCGWSLKTLIEQQEGGTRS